MIKVPKTGAVPSILYNKGRQETTYNCNEYIRDSTRYIDHTKKFKFDRNILELHNTKTGKGKKQFTSIPPDFPEDARKYVKACLHNRCFPFTRQLIWSYVKKACKLAGLEIGEQQDSRYIEGGWTHLIRKSRAKLMDDLGCKEGLIARKLRHSWKNTTDRYVRLDINALIKWEQDNLNGLKD